MPTTQEPTIQFLCEGWNELDDSIRARFFGELVKLAAPVLERYHSDLYHDARWVRENVTGPMVIFFGADDFGTDIGDESALDHITRRSVWRVQLTHGRYGKWSAEILQVR